MQLFIALILLSFMISSHSATVATLFIGENEIVSLATSPAIRNIAGTIDNSGRPVLLATLVFTNSCYAKAGVRALVGLDGASSAYVIILQRINSAGCPDIYQPTDNHVEILLPRAAVDGSVNVIGRPAPSGLVRVIDLSPKGSFVEAGLTVVEAETFEQGLTLPALEMEEILSNAPGQGYLINFNSTFSNCEAGAFKASVFEVPDIDGTPTFDFIVVRQVGRCKENGLRSRISIVIETPQPKFGRFVSIANEPGLLLRPTR